MYADSIDFANSKSDSYTASNSSVMDELNAYFKSYIAGHTEGNNMTMDEAADEIFKGAGFDDAMDMINRDTPSRRRRLSSSSSSSSTSDSGSNPEAKFSGFDDAFDATPEQNLLDVEILDQHIDKAGITGGADATRAIENMAGGNINEQGELDTFDSQPEHEHLNEFANAMLGGSSSKKPRYDTSGPVRGYSGVTSEIRVKGNRVTERNRNGSNYLTEDGYVDMSMLGGRFDSEDEYNQNNHEDGGYDKHGDIKTDETGRDDGFPAEQGPAMEDSEKVTIEKEDDDEHHADLTHKRSDDEEESFGEEEETSERYNDSRHASMASEIDHVLSQLRNKTARTLTGGTVNIRKKVVLTDMYPYIIRT